MARHSGSSDAGVSWWKLVLSFLIPLVGLAFCQSANDRESEQAPYFRAATLAGFVLYLVVFGICFFF